jgi:hypothetical protein
MFGISLCSVLTHSLDRGARCAADRGDATPSSCEAVTDARQHREIIDLPHIRIAGSRVSYPQPPIRGITMAWYKEPKFLKQVAGNEFDQDHSPGSPSPFAGIYRCMGCGREIAIAFQHVLPPQNHHAHAANQGAIRWRLIAFANHEPL